MEEDELRRVLKASGLPRLTPQTITNQTAFLAELKKIRRSKFAIDNQENEPGVCCIGSIIEGSSGGPIAALSISGPAFRLLPHRLRTFKTALRDSCVHISSALQSQRLA
jgi:IclR family acetate operon transcriptional repressor